MKKYSLFFSLLVSIIAAFTPMTAQAQQPGYINWQNNGEVSAFLFSDVDSITFSKVDLDGTMHPNVVVQEVWKQGSAHRIPITNIDSVTFKSPKPVYNDSVFHIRDFHYPYVIEVSESTVTFDASIPADSLPVIGQVIISERAYKEPFLHGFSGRVTNIVTSGNIVSIECEDVNLEDIFTSLLRFGKVVTANEDSTLTLMSDRALDLVDEEGVKTIPFDTQSFDIIRLGNSHVSLDVTPEINLDYLVYIGIGAKDRFRFVANNTMVCDLGFYWDKSFDVDVDYYPDFCSLDIPIVPEIGLNAFISLGGYFKLNGNAGFGVKRRVTLESQVGYDSDYQGIDADHKGLWLDFKKPVWDKTEGFANIDATVSAGLALKVGACLVDEDLASVNLTLKIGPRLSGTLGFNTNLATVYNEHFNDSITFEPLTATLTGGVDVLGFKKDWPLGELPIAQWFPSLSPRTLWLFPRFNAPFLPHWTASEYSATALTTNISKNLIFPVQPGISISGNNRDYSYFSDSSYQYYDNWNGTDLQMELWDGHPYPAGTYTAKPIFKIFGKTVEANDESYFSTVTIPETLEVQDTILIQKGKTRTIDFIGGWGNYKLSIGDSKVCAAYVTGQSIKITALKKGTTTLTIKDERSEERKNISVLVYETAEPPTIVVSPESHDYGTIILGDTANQTFTVTTSNVSDGVSISRTSNTNMFSITKNMDSTTGNGTFTVTYNPTATGTHSMTIYIKCAYGPSDTVTVTGNCLDLSVDKTSLNFGDVVTEYTATRTFTVTGANLTGSLTVSSDNSKYTVSPSTITKEQAASGCTVTVTYEPTTVGSTDNGTITISGGGAENKTISLTGKCVAGYITVTPNPLDFGTLEPGKSLTKSFTVTTNVPGTLSSTYGGTFRL